MQGADAAEAGGTVRLRCEAVHRLDGQLALLESAPANDACYWKLHYSDSSTKADTTLYLTPDGKYLVPSLYDLT